MADGKDTSFRKFGVELIGDIPWGTHLCQFYQTKQDLIDILVPYFKTGLENNEFCMWITAEPLEIKDAILAMKIAMPSFSNYMRKGQIEIISYKDWYLKGGTFDCDRVLDDWVIKLDNALKNGFDGLRLTGNTFWLEKTDWQAFTDYEEAINNTIGKYHMIAVCTYSIEKCNTNEILDVIRNHQFALVKRANVWEIIESSERKRITEDLRRTEQKFTDLYNSMTEGVALHDIICDDSNQPVDYVVTDVNPSFERITGLCKEESVGKRASQLYGTGSPPYLDIYAEVALSRKPTSFETYFPPMKKHFSVSVFSSSKGKFVTVFHDITERKTIEEAIRKQANLIDLSPDGIITRKLNGTITFWSKGAERLYGYTKEEAMGQTTHALLRTEFPESLPSIIRQIKENKIWSGELIHYDKNLKPVIVQSFWQGSFDDEGNITEVFESNVDITERARLQEQLEENATQLEEYANQMEHLAQERLEKLKDAERLAAIGATAGMVGHDIRNPLQAVVGDLYLTKAELASLPESDARNNIKDSLISVEEQIGYINKIVTDLQDYAKPLRPCEENVDLEYIVDDTFIVVKVPENIQVERSTEQLEFVADSAFLKRVLQNLVSNAVQAMPKGGKLIIQTYCERNSVIITVEDTGMGIPENAKAKLFQPLFTTKSKGQGFGLAVCKRLVEAMNGTIAFDSVEGKGTKFMVKLPYRKPRNR